MTLLVFAPPTARWLKHLERLPGDLRIVTGATAEAFPADAIAEAKVIVTTGTHGPLIQELWAGFRNLEWIHSLAAGLESVLFPELVQSPVVVTNARGVFARSLGEFALAGMLWFAKDLNRMRRQQEMKEWKPFDVEELHGRTLGVVGHGSIGRAASELALAFGMKVRGIGRKADRAEFEDVLRAADYLVVAAPLTSETRGMLGAAEIEMLKPACVIINLGRGPVIDEAALIDALQCRRIRGAVLDVFDTEPLPADHPFWTMDQVLLSPHTADHTATWMDECMDLFVNNFDNWRSGATLDNIVDKEIGY